MKRNLKNRTTPSLLFLLLLLAAGCNKSGDHAAQDTYTCPMHPTVIADQPGTCPVCGMDLVRKARAGEAVEITEDLSRLLKSPNEIVVTSIETIKGTYKSVPISIEAQGIVTYDTRNISTIPTRIGGRLEKVFLKYPFQKVTKGQKVAEIYSPELLTAQRELIFLLENDSQNEPIIKSAKERLSLLGASDRQIDDLVKRKEPLATFTIYSPYNGYVISETQAAPVAPAMAQQPSSQSSGMREGTSSSASTSPAGIAPGQALTREGSYVSSGQTLFRVVNPSLLRVELNISSELTGAIEKGSEVTLDFGNEHTQHATVDFIQPFFNEGQEFLIARIYTRHTEALHIGHLVKAILKGKPVEALWVPKQAVLDLGVDKVVFIKDKKVLKPKKVTVGVRTDDLVEIKQGLSSSDEIAANAQYLVDSESFIKTQR